MKFPCVLGESTDYDWAAGRSIDISAAVFAGRWNPTVIGNFQMNESKQFVMSTCLEEIVAHDVC